MQRLVFELDQAVHVISNHLVAGLIFSPGAIRAKSAGGYRVDPVAEIRGALKRISAITHATGWSREDTHRG